MCRLIYIRIFVYTSLELETALLLIKDCMVWRSLTKINANNPIANNTLTTNCCKFLTYPINHQSSRQIVEPAIITVLKSLKLKKKRGICKQFPMKFIQENSTIQYSQHHVNDVTQYQTFD